MDFRTAANILGRQITTADMAKAVGMSDHSVRQARLIEGAPGYRSPPKEWRTAFIELARRRIEELHRLVEEMDDSGAPPDGRDLNQ